jgi:hypothetical protein
LVDSDPSPPLSRVPWLSVWACERSLNLLRLTVAARAADDVGVCPGGGEAESIIRAATGRVRTVVSLRRGGVGLATTGRAVHPTQTSRK